jgi:hypothetical protein
MTSLDGPETPTDRLSKGPKFASGTLKTPGTCSTTEGPTPEVPPIKKALPHHGAPPLSCVVNPMYFTYVFGRMAPPTGVFLTYSGLPCYHVTPYPWWHPSYASSLRWAPMSSRGSLRTPT